MIPVNEVNQIKKLVSGEYSGKLLYVTIGGSHLYGFNSVDSDIDFRGCWLTNTNNILGLNTPRDNIERMEGINDTVLFELKKELNLLHKGNCNILENLFADQLYTSDEYFQIKKIMALNLNLPGIYHSYRGMAWSNYNKFCLKGMHTVKKFLYIFRAILAGIHAIRLRNIEPNINTLLEYHKDESFYESIIQLVKLKKDGKEKDMLNDRLLPIYHKLVEEMFTILDKVYEDSKPSEKIQRDLDKSREKLLDKTLKKIRKNYLSEDK